MTEASAASPFVRVVRSANERRIALLIGLIIAAASFGINLSIEMRLDGLRVFEQDDVLFDADPYTRLESLSHGRTGTLRTFIVHPIFTNYITPAISVVAGTLSDTALVPVGEDQLRRNLALGVAPLGSALKSLLLTWFFFQLGLPLLCVALLTVISCASFSQLIFGSVPDHWMLSGVMLVIAHGLLIDCIRNEGQIRRSKWLIVGVIATSVTITNLFTVCLLVISARILLTGKSWDSLRHGAFMGASILLVTVAIAAIIGFSLRYEPRIRPELYAPPTESELKERKFYPEPGVLGRHFASVTSIPGKLLVYPEALVDTFAAGSVSQVDFQFPVSLSAPHQQMLTVTGPSSSVAGRTLSRVLVTLAMILGTLGWIRLGTKGRALAAACIAVIAMNGVLHAVYGSKYFLFTQHWQVSQLVLIAGAVVAGARWRRLGFTVLSVLLLQMIVTNLHQLNTIFELLA